MANWTGGGGRPQGRRNATAEEKEQFFHLVEEEGNTPEEAAIVLGFHPSSGRNWWNHKLRGGRTTGERGGGDRVWSTPPIPYDDLLPDVQETLQPTPEAFNLFRERFLGTRRVPWQTDAARMLIEAEHEAQTRESTAPVRMLGNVFPGGGKSKTFTHDYVVWRTVMARSFAQDIRIQLGARTLTQSGMYAMRVRSTLTRNRRLVEAFGRFKEQHPRLWEKDAFLIEQLPGVEFDEKEPTVFAVSQQSGFLGARAHIAIWDDLVDKANNRTEEARKALREWWVDEAASRIEPRGVLCLVGTRTGPDDLFANLAKLGHETGQADDQGRPIIEKLYRRYTFPVHALDRCTGGRSRLSADHVDCLNYPERYDWPAILDLMTQGGGRFRLTYQQEDQDLDLALVHLAWIEGTQDEDGISYAGCLDYRRGLWEPLPDHALDDHRGIILVDPSPTEWWAVQLWAFNRKHDLDWLVGMERRRMPADQLLDLEPGTFNYTGVLEDFVMKGRALRLKVGMLIMEANAAQRFMTQYAFFRDWARSRGILIRPHQTHGPGLLDDKYGIQTIGPRFKHGKVRLPWAGPVTRRIVGYLVHEALTYPEGETDDCLKAYWFGHANRDRLGLADTGPRFYTPDHELSPYLAATRHGGRWGEELTVAHARTN
jgi:hypothetical protein